MIKFEIHIINVKPLTNVLYLEAAKIAYTKHQIDISTPAKRIAHIMQSTFNGRRLVVFSGGEAADEASILDQVQSIREGGGHGSIMGRNSFQRSYEGANTFLEKVIDIYRH